MTYPPQQPRRDEADPEEVEFFDALMTRRGEDPKADVDIGYYGRLLGSPAMAAQLSDMGRLVRKAGERPGTYTHAEREFADQVLCADWKTNVVLKTHIPDALATGVRMEAIEALRAGRESELTEDERELASFIRGVVDGRVTGEQWEALEARMGSRGVLEYTIFIVFLQLTIRLYQAVGMPDPPDEEIDALIQELKDGTRELPDFRERIR